MDSVSKTMQYILHQLSSWSTQAEGENNNLDNTQASRGVCVYILAACIKRARKVDIHQCEMWLSSKNQKQF